MILNFCVFKFAMPIAQVIIFLHFEIFHIWFIKIYPFIFT
jgi:hypothetical protein